MKHEYVDQYKRLSPLARNTTLLELFQQLPPYLYDQLPNSDYWISVHEKGVGHDEKDRRRKSDNRAILTERVDSLLTLAPITFPFHTHVLHNYAEWYVTGGDQTNIVTETFNGILFRDHENNPGIFKQPTAKLIEKDIYRHHAFELLELMNRFEAEYQELGLESPPLTYPPDWFVASFHTNPNNRFRDPEKYGWELEETESSARHYRLLIQSWPNEFFKKYGEEI